MALLDQVSGFVRRIVAPTARAGVPGIQVVHGQIQSNEKNPRVKGDKKWTEYADILANIAIVSAGIRYFLRLMTKPSWKVEPAKDSGAEGERIAEVIDKALHEMATPWHRIVRRTAMFPFMGFSIQEWIAKRGEDGAIVYADVEARPQPTIARWDVDEGGTLRGVEQVSPFDYQTRYLPRSKLIYAVDDALTDSPDGFGLLRHIIDSSDRLKQMQMLEVWGFEMDLGGVPIGRAPINELQKAVKAGNLTQADMTKALASLTDFLERHKKNPKLSLMADSMPWRSEDEARTPSSTYQWGVELLQHEGTSQADVREAIIRITYEIAYILGCEHLLVGSRGQGSQALSKSKNDSLSMLVNGTQGDLVEVYEKDLVLPLMRLNGWDEKLKPSLKPDRVQFRDVEEVTAALETMSRAGAPLMPDDPANNEVRDLLGVSHAPDISEPLDMHESRKPTDPIDPNMPPGEDDPDKEPA